MVSVRLISHASVIIEAGSTRILTDPWLFGTCFNESWALITEPAPFDLDVIDYLWISHEHPDHLHIPTLKALPESFKARVPALFQRSSDAEKMVAALGQLGFRDIRLLPNRQWIKLGSAEALCFQSRQIDSALAVRHDGKTVLNLNDCDLSPRDFAGLRKLVGAPDILLNQFSLAGFDGVEADLPRISARILDDMVIAHRALSAKVTIPFASFHYFCQPDNAFLNDYANTPAMVAERFAAEGLSLCLKGDWRQPPAPRPVGRPTTLGEIRAAFREARAHLKAHHGIWLRLLRPIVVSVPEHGRIALDFARGRLSRTDGMADVQIGAQPLHFMLSHPFGLQTLGVSGRWRLLMKSRSWRLLRIFCAMMNAGIGLSLAKALRRSQLAFFWSRRSDIFGQIAHSLAAQPP